MSPKAQCAITAMISLVLILASCTTEENSSPALERTSLAAEGAAFISHVVPAAIPGGAVFTVRGTGFGSNKGSVNIGGTSCEVAEWTDTAVVATAPAESVSGKVELTTGSNELASRLPVAVIGSSGADVPIINSVEGTDADDWIDSGATLTIRGEGFGAVTGEVHLDQSFDLRTGQSSAEVLSWSDTEIQAAMPADCSGQVAVRVKTGIRVLFAPGRVRCP